MMFLLNSYRAWCAAFRAMDGNFYRRFCQLAVPMGLQLIMASSLALVDVLMLSSQGAPTVAAVGLVGKFFFVIILLVAGLANGAGILAAQYVGSGDTAGVKRVLAIALACAWCVTLPISVACYCWPEQILGLMASDPALIAAGTAFLRITAPFHIITATIAVLSAVLRATGRASLPMLAGFVAIVCNTVLNYFLIFGNYGAPKWGVVGAAVATLVAKIVECGLLLAVIYASGSLLALRWREIRASFGMTQVRSYLRQSVPLALNEGVWALGIFAFSLVYGHMGTHALASVTMLGPIESISIEIFIGFTNAAAIMISTSLGARQFAHAKQLAWVTATLVTGGALLYGGLLIAARPLILALYHGADAQVLFIANDVLLAIGLTLWLRLGNCVTCVSVLRSGGDVKFTLYVDLVVIWLLVLPMTAYAGLVLHWPVQWVFGLALAGEGIIKAPIYLWRIAGLRWLTSLVPALEATQPAKEPLAPGQVTA